MRVVLVVSSLPASSSCCWSPSKDETLALSWGVGNPLRPCFVPYTVMGATTGTAAQQGHAEGPAHPSPSFQRRARPTPTRQDQP